MTEVVLHSLRKSRFFAIYVVTRVSADCVNVSFFLIFPRRALVLFDFECTEEKEGKNNDKQDMRM